MYRARYRDPDGMQRAKHFSKKADAGRWLTRVESTKLDGSYVDPGAGKQEFGSYVDAWLSRQIHRPSTRAQVASHLRNHIRPAFDSRTLGSVRPSDIQAFVKELNSKLAPATVEVVYRHTASIFIAAVEDRIISQTPCRGIKLPKRERALVNPLSSSEVLALVEAVPDRYTALVLCAAGSGLRQGEIFGLTVEHVNFLQRQIRVEKQLVQIVGEPEFGPPKTEASRRIVPVPSVVMNAIASHLKNFGPGPHDLIFTDDHRRSLRRNRFSAKVWQPAVAASHCPPETTFHDLRHYYASLLINASESVKTVQARLGHSSAIETLDTYGHLWPDSEDRTRSVVEEAFTSSAPALGEDDLRTISPA